MSDHVRRAGYLQRRQFFGLAGAASVSLLLAACSGKPTADSGATGSAPTDGAGSTTPSTGASPVDASSADAAAAIVGPPGPGGFPSERSGGRVVTGWTSEANSYDAALGYDLQSWEAINCLLYTTLYQFDGQDGGPAPSAAQDMPQISDDETVYTIPLRTDFTFHNGRAVTAQDYVYSLTRVLDPELASWASSYLYSIKGAEDFNNGDATSVAGLRAVNDTTLEVTLTAPDITFMTMLCLAFTAAVPQEEVERLGDAFSQTPVGNGPFKISEYDSAGQRALFVANDAFPWKDVPLLDEVEYRWGIDASVQFLQVKNGDLDILGEGLPNSAAAQLAADKETFDTYVVDVPINALNYMPLNLSNKALSDPRVRQALNWATNRDQIATFLHGRCTPWGKAFPAHEAEYVSTTDAFDTDLDKAKSLLADAGFPTLSLDMILNADDEDWNATAQVIQQQWAQVGVTLTIQKMSGNSFWSAVEAGQGDLYGTVWYQVQPSGLDIASENYLSAGSSNYYGYANDQVDTLIGEAKQAPTLAESNTVLAEVEKLVTEDAPAVFIGSMDFLAVRGPRVQEYHMRGETGSYYDRMWV